MKFNLWELSVPCAHGTGPKQGSEKGYIQKPTGFNYKGIRYISSHLDDL